MAFSIHSAAIIGAGARTVEVQVDLSLGLPGFFVVGLPDHVCQDARTRVVTALRNAKFPLPQKKITVNLAPADLRKEGPSFDLPIALGVLAGAELLPPVVRPPLVVGELSLSGDVLPVRGVLPVALEAKRRGFDALIVPEDNAREGALVQGLRVYGARTLGEAAELFAGVSPLAPARFEPGEDALPASCDLSEVRGQPSARLGLEIAAAGGHNALFIGSPGAGKTMLARRLPTLLPPLSFEEAVEVTSVFSIAGRLGRGMGLVRERPFRAPHHTISVGGLVGAGSPPRPGEVTLANHGALFLDELPEFGRAALEALRQPLEDGEVTIARASGAVTLPARFMLIAAMNPCPCGHAHDPDPGRCCCTLFEKERYLRRISGPILDRFDLHIETRPLSARELLAHAPGESSRAVRERVLRARELQARRYRALPGVVCNGQLQGAALRELCAATEAARQTLGGLIERRRLSARAWDRMLKVARTIADLAASETVDEEHVLAAAQLRCLDAPVEGRAARSALTETQLARVACIRGGKS